MQSTSGSGYPGGYQDTSHCNICFHKISMYSWRGNRKQHKSFALEIWRVGLEQKCSWEVQADVVVLPRSAEQMISCTCEALENEFNECESLNIYE
jgi:hypothetical protein